MIEVISKKDNYALIIGIGSRNDNEPNLSITADDADRFTAELLNRCSFLKSNVRLLINQNASNKNIETELKELASVTKEKQADLVIVFFSGHGCMMGGSYYLVCHNTVNSDLQYTACKGSEFVKMLQAINTERLLLLLDCCHSNGIAKPVDIPFNKEDILPLGNRIIISSSHASQVSYLSRPFSIFTYALIEGIAGKYFLAGDQNVTVFDLAMYIRERVMQLSKNLQQPQLNILNNGKTTNFVLARYPNGEPHEPAFAEKFTLLDANGKEINTEVLPKKDEDFRNIFQWLNIKQGTGSATQIGGPGSNQTIIYNNSVPEKALELISSIMQLKEVSINKQIKHDIIITSEPPTAWQFHKDFSEKWIPITSPKNLLLRENYQNTVQYIQDKIKKSDEIKFLGFPKVGKSTYIMQLMKSLSEEEGKTALYIPNQNFSLNDYLNILETEKYKQTVTKQHIIGLDNFALSQESQDIFRNSTLCIVPMGLSNPLTSEFIMPFSELETMQFITDKSLDVELNSIIIRTIVSYSAGIPRLVDLLLTYFIFHKNLSINSLITDTEISRVLDNIYDDFILRVDKNTLKLWVGLISLGKSVSSFSNSINNFESSNSSSFTLIQKLGFDTLIKSPLLLAFFKNKIGENAIKDFKKEGIKEFISENLEHPIGVWTVDNEFKYFKKGATILKAATNIFKSDTLIDKIDWDKSLLNNQRVPSKEIILTFGDEVNFIFGRRSTERPRSPEYKKINKKFKELISKGDSASKKENWAEAEKLYSQCEDLEYEINNKFKSDSNYAKVRLANLLRVQGKLEQAILICHPIVRSTPNPFAHLCLGICLFWKGNFMEALLHFDKSLAFKPNYINAKLWKVRVLIHTKSLDQADNLLKTIDKNKINNDTQFILILLNYVLELRREFPQKIKFASCRKNAFFFISANQKQIPIRQIPIIKLFLDSISDKENEFSQIQNNLPVVENFDICEVDLFWWKIIIRL